MNTSSGFAFAAAGFTFALCAASASATTYGVSTTALLQEYADDLSIEDHDGDNTLTDRDFQLWAIDLALSPPLQDVDCNSLLNAADAVLTLGSFLRGLAADHNGNYQVDEDDIVFVINHLYTYNSDPAKGDLNADGLTDPLDLAQAVDRIGRPVALNPVAVAFDILSTVMSLEPALAALPLPNAPPCTPDPETCGNAVCKGTCVDPTTGTRWKYRFYMIGFCGSQFEAADCCQSAISIACNCNTSGFTLHCWSIGQGSFISCLLMVPD